MVGRFFIPNDSVGNMIGKVVFIATFFVVCPADGNSSKRLSTAMCPAGISGGGGRA